MAAKDQIDVEQKNNKINKTKMEEVSKCCDGAFDLLEEIRNKIVQIIEFKKKNPTGGGDELFRRQIAGYLAALENLTKINSNVENAVTEVKDLCAEANLLLGKIIAAEKVAARGLGLGGSETTEEKEDK